MLRTVGYGSNAPLTERPVLAQKRPLTRSPIF
jgi:hypothetical protein